jgi:pimeloyl-ACP methyl ester carboxylesterase
MQAQSVGESVRIATTSLQIPKAGPILAGQSNEQGELRNVFVKTPAGTAVFTAETHTPKVLMIHGFKRTAGQLASWRERIPDLGFIHLPGHDIAPEMHEVSVKAWIDVLRQMMTIFPEPPLLIAESLGAVVATSLPSRALIAVEPVLSTDQLWPLRRTIERARARGIDIPSSYEALFEQPFDWAVERIKVPTLVLAGSEPLLPERAVLREPSMLTDKDFATYARHPLVEAYRIKGGHTLLDHNPDGVMAAAAEFMATHGYL